MEGRRWGNDPVPEPLKPVIMVPMCDVPDGKMPAAATRFVGRALALGLKVRSTYAAALVPDLLRAGVRVTELIESVAVRFTDGSGWRGYAMWHNGSFKYAFVGTKGNWPVRVSWDGVYVLGSFIRKSDGMEWLPHGK